MTNSSNMIDCCWLQSSSFHKWWRSGSTWLQNPKVSRHSSCIQSIWVLGPYFCVWWLFKISLIYDYGCEKRNPNHPSQHGLNFGFGNFEIIHLDRSSFSIKLQLQVLLSLCQDIIKQLFFTCFLDQPSCL